MKGLFYMFPSDPDNSAGDWSDFNADLGSWDTSKVTDLTSMFHNAVDFTGGGISKWNTAKVTTMHNTFQNDFVYRSKGKSFLTLKMNADLSGWDVGKVILPEFTDADFYQATWDWVKDAGSAYFLWANWGGDPGNWNVRQVKQMEWALSVYRNEGANSAGSYKQIDENKGMSEMANFNTGMSGISKWITTGVVGSLRGMFKGAAAFNADLGGWDVSKGKPLLRRLFN